MYKYKKRMRIVKKKKNKYPRTVATIVVTKAKQYTCP